MARIRAVSAGSAAAWNPAATNVRRPHNQTNQQPPWVVLPRSAPLQGRRAWSEDAFYEKTQRL